MNNLLKSYRKMMQAGVSIKQFQRLVREAYKYLME
ncbi:hypothetical protein [Lysinibacillus xylanilyticus]